MAPECPGPNNLNRRLPAEFQSKLNVARSTGSDHRIRRGNVAGVLNLPKAAGHSNIVAHELLLGILEMWGVENVEELGAELHPRLFRQLPALHHRDVPLGESDTAAQITTHVAKWPDV